MCNENMIRELTDAELTETSGGYCRGSMDRIEGCSYTMDNLVGDAYLTMFGAFQGPPR